MQSFEKPAKILRVLVVEDDAARAEKLKSWLGVSLAEFNPQFEIILNYDLALAAYRHQPHDILILSRSDDAKKVCAFATEVRQIEKSRHSGIVLFYPDEILEDDFVIQCLEAGIDDCIASYINPEVRLARFKTIIKLKHMTDELRRANHRLRLMSITDDLTQLYNMRGFQKILNSTFENFTKNKIGLGVLMMDLDLFKNVNDTHNHLAGSKIIADVGKILKTNPFATQAIFGRYGGDEYIGLLKCNGFNDAKNIAEWILTTVRNHSFFYQEHAIRLTCSVGVAWVDSTYTGSVEMLIKKADECLYRSKHQGRDQINLDTLGTFPLLVAV